MRDRHEPDEEFVDRLEWQVSSEVRRRNRAAVPRPGFLSTPVRVALSAALLVVVSMSFGAAAVAASYQIEESWRRDLLISALEVRLDVARQREAIAAEQLGRVNEQFQIGSVDEIARDMARLQLAQAQSAVGLLELEREEVELGGREPLDEISAPRLGTRDFVGERLERRLDLARTHAELGRADLQRTQRRFEAGVISRETVDSMQLAVRQLRDEVNALENRLTFRRGFLAGEISALEAELYVLRNDAERRLESLRQLHMLTAVELEETRSRVEVGVIDDYTLSAMELRFAELEGELRLAELELEIVQRQLDARRQER